MKLAFLLQVIIFSILNNGADQKPVDNLLDFDDPVSYNWNSTVPISVDRQEERYSEMGKKNGWKKTQEVHTMETKWEESYQEKTEASGESKILQVNKQLLTKINCIVYALASMLVLVFVTLVLLIILISLKK